MYTYEIWNRQDAHGLKAKDIMLDINNTTDQVYFIILDDKIVLIQTETYRPYKTIILEDKTEKYLTFEESAKMHCNEMNKPVVVDETIIK